MRYFVKSHVLHPYFGIEDGLLIVCAIGDDGELDDCMMMHLPQKYKYVANHSCILMRRVHGDPEVLRLSGERAEKAGNIIDALVYYQAAVAKYSDMGMNRKVATLQSKIGDCLSSTRKYRDATAFYRQSLNILHVCGDESEIGDCYYRLGLCHMNLGKNDEARRHLEAAEFCFRRAGDGPRASEIKTILSSIGM